MAVSSLLQYRPNPERWADVPASTCLIRQSFHYGDSKSLELQTIKIVLPLIRRSGTLAAQNGAENCDPKEKLHVFGVRPEVCNTLSARPDRRIQCMWYSQKHGNVIVLVIPNSPVYSTMKTRVTSSNTANFNHKLAFKSYPAVTYFILKLHASDDNAA